ncbi:uncharacterized protein PRCAT00001337001 [Priceomyces carsonii]|uniref:uncharacterized protein n=1 Tax=Priceomyces carsonii TaxID=28549 RepID=UPI002ED7CBE9|nr:unnamed protein product [Priceomyces carsonii]
MERNTIGLYLEFLTLIESEEFNDNLISVESLQDLTDALAHSLHQQDFCVDLPMNLGMDVDSFYNKLGSSDNDSKESLGRPKTEEYEVLLKNSCNSCSSITGTVSVPVFKEIERSSVNIPPADQNIEEDFENMGCYTSESDDSEAEESERMFSKINPVVPGLFPSMNSSDKKQFMRPKDLPLLPSHTCD